LKSDISDTCVSVPTPFNNVNARNFRSKPVARLKENDDMGNKEEDSSRSLTLSDEGVEILLDAAQKHGSESEPDMEVGDLQIFARVMWKHLGRHKRLAVVEDSDVKDLVDEWL
jgi:hypothetical protein